MKNICAPALLYLILGILSIFILIQKDVDSTSIFIKLFFVIIWTWFLNFLCKNGYETISWILVLLPFILLIVFLLFLFRMLKK
jgi:hypothetical protein